MFLTQRKKSIVCLFFTDKHLLGTTETSNDDDFSWEDEEEELSSTSDGKPVIVKNKPSIASVWMIVIIFKH